MTCMAVCCDCKDPLMCAVAASASVRDLSASSWESQTWQTHTLSGARAYNDRNTPKTEEAHNKVAH